MASSVELPKLGLRPPAALVAEWYLPDGAAVQRGEAICRVEAENVAVEIEADDEGVLRHRLEAGYTRAAGDVLGVILGAGERMPDFSPVDDDEPPGRTPVMHTGPSDAEWEEAVRAFRYWPPDPPSPKGEGTVSLEPTTLPVAAPPAAEAAEAEPERAFEPVPFPKRFQGSRPPSWDSVPGDSVDFASGLFERSDEPSLPFAGDPGKAAALETGLEAASTTGAGVIDEPSAEEVAPAESVAVDLAGGSPETYSEPVPELVAELHTLTMRVRVDLSETRKLEEQLARAWREAGLAPAFEDVLVRAAARALDEGGFGGGVVLRWYEDDCEQWAALHDAGVIPFREAVALIRSGTEGGHDAGCVITTYAGIDEAVPQLPGDAFFAIGVGDETKDIRWDGRRRMLLPMVTLTLAFEGSRVSEFAAARFLARIRDLVEAPYALLAA